MAPSRLVRHAAALAAALCIALTRPAAAQGVRGVVVTGDSVAVAGAVVTLLDSLDRVAVTTLTDEGGYFTLRAPRRGTWRLRAEAVGFARVTSFPFVLSTTELLVRRIQLTDATAAMRGIEVRDRTACDVRPAEGTQIALLWDEARKSFAAAAASVATAPPVAFDLDEIEYDSTFLRVRSASRITTTGRAEAGFRSDSPRALRQLGYSRRVDTTSTYFAPDAQVLLSDDFAATHCFRIIPDDPTSVRRVGLGFAPVGLVEGKLEVAGTIWLDRTTYELDRVEFRYEPLLNEDFPDSTFGGRVRFSRLATGHVVVSHFVLRMPIYAAADEGRVARSGQTSQMLIRAERRETVAGVKFVRGVTRAFEVEPEPLPVVNAAPRRSAGAPSCADVAPVGGNSGGITGEVHDARDRAAGGARVRATWHEPIATGGRIVFREQWAESGADGFGRYALCALPSGVPLKLSATRENAQSPRSRVVLVAGRTAPVIPLALAAAARGATAPTTGTVSGRIIGRESRPVVNAEVRVFPGTKRLTTDSTGAFRATAAEPGLQEFFVRRVGYAPMMIAVEVFAGDTAEVVLALEQAPQLLAPVTVEATMGSVSLAGFELRRKVGLGGGKFIGPEELDRRRSWSVTSLLRAFTPVHIEESAAMHDARMYGRDIALSSDSTVVKDRCQMRVMIDGALMPNETPMSGLPPVREIAAIEVYLAIGAVPAMYNFAQPECGLMVIWLRDGSEPTPP